MTLSGSIIDAEKVLQLLRLTTVGPNQSNLLQMNELFQAQWNWNLLDSSQG